MKKILSLIAIVGLMSVGLLAGCQKQAETTPPTTPDMPTTNVPAPPAPDMPATNAPAK